MAICIGSVVLCSGEWMVLNPGKCANTVKTSTACSPKGLIPTRPRFLSLIAAMAFGWVCTLVDGLSQIRDTVPPKVARVLADCKTKQLIIQFSEAIDPRTGAVAQNYVVSGGFAVLTARVDAGRTFVTLQLSGLPAASGTVFVSNVTDLADNTILPKSAATFLCLQTETEIDEFPSTFAQFTLSLPGGQTEVVTLTGPTTVEVAISSDGFAEDTDRDGLDQVTTVMTRLQLQGTSTLGPVLVTLDTKNPSVGIIEERANQTRGVLDVPPFTKTGTADSFFDVYFLVTLGDRVFHPAKPVHMTSVITHKPPAPGDTYTNPFNEAVELLDATGKPSGIRLLREVCGERDEIRVILTI